MPTPLGSWEGRAGILNYAPTNFYRAGEPENLTTPLRIELRATLSLLKATTHTTSTTPPRQILTN